MVASRVAMKDVDWVQKMVDMKADELVGLKVDEKVTRMVRHLVESKEIP